jgi:RHH-type proline utilization regulon transcriptional repressor/proline dehydrogenase/delta 1-pyrroline-5-carboxylate dehydrogenase
MAEQRFDTISYLVHHGKKAIREADAEVSEAIDFARYYSGAFDVAHTAVAGVSASALGVVVVTPPWNFPLAIPAGGTLAALMAGNAVILKPSRETPEVAWHLVNQLWASGVPRDVLQFFPCSDSELGRALVTHPGVDAVVLTGSYETARMFLNWRPSLRLFAETSGKNAIVITALADRDLAIRDLVHSAFGHAGQKCSAASLAIVEAEVYDDPSFRRQLCDAASSLPVGPSIDSASVVTPLIKPPGDSLRRALTTLDAGESWLLEPRQLGADPCAWAPGIKLGVKPGSWFHQTECFGPVFGLIRVHDLDEAIEVQNGVEFGLTAGLHSLDEREIAAWRERVAAGNLYINRHITGAIVQRQPFGGWKKSSFGPGAKAGGPNYVWSFCQFTDRTPCQIERARESYTDAWREYFSLGHDPSGLRAETNLFRYRPCRGVIVRLDRKDDDALALAHLAAEICHVPFEASVATDESVDELAARLPILAARAEFFRTIDTPPDALLRAAHAAGLHWINAPFVSEGRLELRHWLREQIVSETRHRYGNVMA